MKTLNVKDVPDSHHELFIAEGYRPVPCSLGQGLKSAFSIHNELINFWTHFIPGVEMARRMYVWEWHWSDPRSLSMMLFMMSITIMFMTSSFAHLLNCISFRARHICFCSDYAAILYYSLGCVLINSTTLIPNQIWDSMFVGANSYLSLNLAVSSLILLLICETRMPNAKHKYIYRTLSFVVPFVLANYPFFKMYAKSALVQHYFNIHALSLLIGAIFNVTKYPEKLAPLSNFFLSHHFMHIGTAIGVYANYFMCVKLYEETKQNARYENWLQLTITGLITLLFSLYIYYFSLRFISRIKASDYIRKEN